MDIDEEIKRSKINNEMVLMLNYLFLIHKMVKKCALLQPFCRSFQAAALHHYKNTIMFEPLDQKTSHFDEKMKQEVEKSVDEKVKVLQNIAKNFDDQ